MAMMSAKPYDSIINPKSLYTDSNNVLNNKLSITDEQSLNTVEANMSTYKNYLLHFDTCSVDKYREDWIKIKFGKFDTEHYAKIHEFLFGEIYEFAGKFRDENIQKGNTPFCRPEFIYQELKKNLDEMKKKVLTIKSREEYLAFLAYYFGELNIIHPFREGNGRCEREFLKEFTEKFTEYSIDYSLLTEEDRPKYIRASIESVYGKYDGLVDILNKIVILKFKKQEMKEERTKII